MIAYPELAGTLRGSRRRDDAVRDGRIDTFFNPTKIPGYLAAGLPAVSTPMRGVIRPYGKVHLARISPRLCKFVQELLSDSKSFANQSRADEFPKG